MASKQYDAYSAGYDQPGDPPAYTGPPAGQPYVYPPSPAPAPQQMSTTNVVIASQPQIIMARPRQTDWTVPAILATIFCFFPTGICAIIAAVMARSAYDAGDYEGERSGTAWARGLTLTSIAIGTLGVILIIVLYIVLVANTVNTIENTGY